MAARISKINVWFKHYLNNNCSTTFLNKTESAKKAKYKCISDDSFRAIGHQNFVKCSKKINKWLDEDGLSDAALKIKLLSLLNAKESKFQKIKGAITSKDFPDNVKKIVESGLIEYNKAGDKEYGTGETIISIEVASIETQRKTLDMALKVKGLNTPVKHELTGKDGGPIETKAHGMDMNALNKALGIGEE